MKKCENEEKLIAKTLKGNAAAFGELVSYYEKFVFNVAFSFMSNYDDAFDVAQEAFIKAWEKLSTFKGDAAFSTWLYRITANTAKDALAKRNKAWNDAEADENTVSTNKTPEEEAVKRENARELANALAALDGNMREIIILRELDGLSYTEISKALGIEEGTVKSRLSRAREKLREILREQNHEYFVKRDKER
ncbi:MAG: sigma-70 family RNA polymerase sigma factor [Ruminococcaceae bacterium]|nr:sigma-70 family RNA polymerase sigma factor [Oscillospiraceae bacterium]